MTEAVKAVDKKAQKAQEEKDKRVKELEDMVKDPEKGFDSDMDTYPAAVKEREMRERKETVVRNAVAALEQIRVAGMSGVVPEEEKEPKNEKVLAGHSEPKK